MIKRIALFVFLAGVIMGGGLTSCYSAQHDTAVVAHLPYALIFLAAFFILFVITVILCVSNFLAKKRFEKKYNDQKEFISAVYDSLPDFLYSKDINGVFTSYNKSLAAFMGCDEREMIGKKIIELRTISSDVTAAVAEVDAKVIKEGKISKVEEWVLFPDGSSRLLEIVKTPLMHDGEVIGLLGIDRDITEHKEAVIAAHSASRAKSNFLAKMSHEIRTPMNAIIGMAELALRASTLVEAKQYTFTAKQAGRYLLSIINDILDFSKIEMGKLEITPGDYSFSSMLNDIISIIRMRVVDSQLRFAINIDSSIPSSLYGDETRMRQILLNLLTNAVKFTEKGFVLLTVTGTVEDNGNVNLVIEVTDTGKGIKQEDIDSLFKEYMQIDYDENRNIEGTGLGLAITRDIIKKMGGEITVSSEYGKGSTFTVMLTQKKRSDEVLASVKNPEEVNVLIYERRAIYAFSFGIALDNLGVPCTQVTDDMEFCETIANKPYTHIFIPFLLFERNISAILNFCKDARIIILAEFGTAIADKNFSTLVMPAYSIPIANILNGLTDNSLYSENIGNAIQITAPKAKVLIVDDIMTNLKVTHGLLLPYKMKVDLCKCGKEALEALAVKRYDLIFMDHKMPNMDGFETTMRIRKMESGDGYYKNVPIIALTANAISGIREEFLVKGFSDFLSKPIDTARLNFVLEKWLPKHKQKRVSKEESASISVIESSVIVSDISDRGIIENGVFAEINIEGIDIGKSFFKSAGTVELFYETLAIFYKDGKEKIREIQTCIHTGDLELFTIHVHALKSASANIGALELSETAAFLENAGKHNETDDIKLHTPAFLVALDSLLEKIAGALEDRKQISVEKPCDMEYIGHILAELKTALQSLDAGTVNRTIRELQKAAQTGDIADAVGSISDKILFGEYDEAQEIVDDLLKPNSP